MQDAERQRQTLEQSWGEILKNDPQQIRAAVDFARRFYADPVENVAQILQELFDRDLQVESRMIGSECHPDLGGIGGFCAPMHDLQALLLYPFPGHIGKDGVRWYIENGALG